MKLDIDSILYIVITIVILIISGLGSRRRKKARQMQVPGSGPADPGSFEPVPGDTMESGPGKSGYATVKEPRAPAQQQAASPLERLEQFLTGQFPQAESMEGESLEEQVDEEELILEQIRREREEPEVESPVEEPADYDFETEKTQEKLPPLFENADEIKKAVIYSEILKRKYE